MVYEECFESMKKLRDWHSANQKDRNEATTRVDLIDRLFFECLGWQREDSTEEEPHGPEYFDYIFAVPRELLIVEAKKEGINFEIPSEKKRQTYSIESLCAGNLALRAALNQVGGYCRNRGVEFGAVTNGTQIVAFIATRIDKPPMNGRAIVFSSLTNMVDQFVDLWGALSKQGIQEGKLRTILGADLVPDLPPKLSSKMTNYPGVKLRNTVQSDLQIMADLVLEDVARTPDLEELFLAECYCESGALSQYALTSKEILTTRYASLTKEEKPAPLAEPVKDKKSLNPELLSQSLSNRPILLIGDVGAGKTMFTRHLMKVEAKNIFSKSVSFYIDLGSQAALTMDLRKYIQDDIVRQLDEHYEVDINARNFVTGVYDSEMKKFQKGIYSNIRESDPATYKLKELERLEQLLSNGEEHIRRSLEHLMKARRQQVIMFLDNCDQRTEEIQQQAFLIAQEIASRWPVMIFVALRPETFYHSQQFGTLSGYHAKAFTIAPPRVDKVLEKRLGFALKITSGEIHLTSLERHIGIKLAKLDEIITVFINSLNSNRGLAELIDNVSGGNIRLALDLTKNFFGSGHVDTEKILKIFEETGEYVIPIHELLRAIIYGDSAQYDPDRSIIVNLFDIHKPDPKEHFLMPLALATIESAGSNSEGGFAEIGKVYESLQALGFLPAQIDRSISVAIKKKLLEGSGPADNEIEHINISSLRVTSSGLYHIKRLCGEFVYLDAVCVDTPVLDNDARVQIRDVGAIESRMNRAEVFCDYLDSSWSNSSIKSALFDWEEHSANFRKIVERVRTRVEQNSATSS